jgi:hypothetical protein
MLGSVPPAVEPRFVCVPEPETKNKDPWPRVSVPRIPASIPRDVAFRVALDIWDQGPKTLFRLGMHRPLKKRAGFEGEDEFYRFVVGVIRRYRIYIDQVVWIATNLCDREILCDYLGLRVTSQQMDMTDPLRPGTARVAAELCSCGLECSLSDSVTDPDRLREADDTRPVLSDKHTQDKHRFHLIKIYDCDFIRPVVTLTKVNILEIIEPKDPRYRNHRRWVRGTVHGRMMYVRAWGLRNTVY